MKKSFVIALMSFFFYFAINAQDSLKISAGFMFAPQAGLSLKNDGVEGFDAFWLLHEVVFISKGKFTFVQMYTLNTNALAGAISYQATSNIGVYGIYSQRIFEDGNYLGAGMSLRLANGRASGFVEFGSSLIQDTPAIYTGVFIPMTFKIR